MPKHLRTSQLRLITRLSQFLSLTLVLAGTAWAQHGGKAEGKRIEFKPGSTSATFTDRIPGAVEVEYQLDARAGQELIVRIVSDPVNSVAVNVIGPDLKEIQLSCLAAKLPEARQLGLPTSSHCFDDNPQILRREGKAWSVTLPKTGNYLLSFFKPGGNRGTSTYSMKVIVPKSGTTETLSPPDARMVEAAMKGLIVSLQKKDVTKFLSFFSRRTFFYANNPLNVDRATVPYLELERDLRRKGPWYYTYIERGEGGDMDAFVDNIGNGEMWPRLGGARFVPPGSSDDSLTYVQWAKEDGRWVVYEIAYPQA
jgi:hypothetical protein